MKKILIIMMLFAFAIKARSESFVDIDSIRIVGCDYFFETTHSIGRYDFIKRYLSANLNDCEEKSYPNFIDFTIKDLKDIKDIIIPLSNLNAIDTLTYSSQEILMKAVYSEMGGNIVYCIDQTHLDLRLALLIFKKDHVEFVWIGCTMIEMGKYRYQISNDIIHALSRYTHLFLD